MKKYFSQGKYRQANLRKAKRSNEARRFSNVKSRRINRFRPNAIKKLESHERRFGKYKHIVAPPNFTLVGNPHPEKVIAFINRLKECLDKKKKVFVVLSHITTIENDAIAVLLSAIVRFKALGVPFDGNTPDNWHCRQVLQESGFFQAMHTGRYLDINSYLLKSQTKNLMVHASREVDSARTANIIEEAAITIWGERNRCQGVQTTFLELMQNTMNHASLTQQGEKHWWLAVKHQQEENKVRFIFVDYGVGVFTSLENKPSNSKFFGALTKMRNRFKYGNNAELLQLILKGELHMTITEEYYRGQGLPGMVDSLKVNWFSNLHIITNNVYANIAANEFKLMSENFGGTFIYWEVSAQNRRFPMTT
jgi:hypothetical protein